MSTAMFRTAICHGFCTIDKFTARVDMDVSDPDTKDIYFIVHVVDYWGRSFIALLKEDGEQFMIAIQYNKDVIKPTGDDKLFVTGGNPLTLSDINLDDMELLHAAVCAFTH